MPVVIAGAGGLGREVLAALDEAAAFFLVEPQHAGPESVAGLAVRSDPASWREAGRSRVVLAIGDGRARQRLAAQLTGAVFVAVRHPGVTLGPRVTVEPGAMLIGPANATVDVIIGAHALINPGCTLAHDCRIGSFASLGPSVVLAGRVTLEEGASLGAGVVIAPGCRIGAWAVVGAGAVVIRDVPPGARVAGVPAAPV